MTHRTPLPIKVEDFQKGFSGFMGETVHKRASFCLTEGTKPVAMVVPYEEYQELLRSRKMAD